jgi:hypothetical protein
MAVLANNAFLLLGPGAGGTGAFSVEFVGAGAVNVAIDGYCQ